MPVPLENRTDELSTPGAILALSNSSDKIDIQICLLILMCLNHLIISRLVLGIIIFVKG